jgi:Fe-S cluster assembly ATPase SufC
VLGDDDAGLVLDGIDDGLDIDVVGDVAAAVTYIHADSAGARRRRSERTVLWLLAHAGTFRLSR